MEKGWLKTKKAGEEKTFSVAFLMKTGGDLLSQDL